MAYKHTIYIKGLKSWHQSTFSFYALLQSSFWRPMAPIVTVTFSGCHNPNNPGMVILSLLSSSFFTILLRKTVNKTHIVIIQEDV